MKTPVTATVSDSKSFQTSRDRNWFEKRSHRFEEGFELFNACGHNGTIEHEEALSSREVPGDESELLSVRLFTSQDALCGFRRGEPVITESELVSREDFRDFLDESAGEVHQCPCCKEDFNAMGICLTCNHPDIKPGEICLASCMEVDLFEALELRTKRKVRAVSDDGTILSEEFCAVMIARTEMEEIVILASLPKNYFV